MRRHALDVIRSWPAESRKPASWLLHVHGEPHQVADGELVWDAIEPWNQIIATREFEHRDWPEPHTASVRSVIRYRVPADRVDAVAELGPSIHVDDERGLVTAIGPDLRTNLLTLNLMHDVVTGTIDAAEARRRYAAATTAPVDGTPPEDMMTCRFDDLETTEPDAVPPSDRAGETTDDETDDTERDDVAPLT